MIKTGVIINRSTTMVLWLIPDNEACFDHVSSYRLLVVDNSQLHMLTPH
jgi:hypothetical protein